MRSTFAAGPGLVFDVRSHGPKLDARRLRNCTASLTGGVTVVDCTAAVPASPPTTADVGKVAIVKTDTAAGTITTIASVSANTVTLAANTGVTGTVYLIWGTDDSAAITSTLNDAAAYALADTSVGPNQPQSLGHPEVVIPPSSTGSGCLIASQITVPTGVSLRSYSLLFNALSDRYAPLLIVSPGAWLAGRLEADALFGTGLQIGTAAGTQADCWWDEIKLWSVGKSVETSGLLRSQDAVALLGFGFLGGQVWAKGGARTLYMNAGSDLQLAKLFCIGAHTGLWLSQSNQVAIGVVHLDSCGEVGGGYDGVVFDNAVSDVSLPSVKIFCVTGLTRTLDNAINIGKTSSNKCVDWYIGANIQKTGGVGVNLNNAQDFRLDTVLSNTASNSSGGANITTGVVFGTVAGSGRVTAEMNGTITPYSGTPSEPMYYTRGGVEYLVQGNSAPTVAALTANGTTPAAVATVSPSNDARGTVTFGSGTGPTSGDQVSVTFASGNAYATAPRVILQPLNSATQALGLYVKDSPTVTGFTVSAASAPTASQSAATYKVGYQVVG
jgi:hypothetical protein